jgi:hypothetical protein
VRIRRHERGITLRDRVALHWALGLFLLAGGVLAIAMPLGLATNAGDLSSWERLASVLIGAGVSAGALWWLWRSPRTEVEFDLPRGSLRVARIGLSGRRVWEVAVADLATVEVETSADTDGKPVVRPVVTLKDAQRIPLSALWSHDAFAAGEVARTVAKACGLPVPRAPLERGS